MAGVYVGAELRGRGAGRQLLAALVAHARAVPGLGRLTLAAATQPAALALYRSLCFARRGCEPAAPRVTTGGGAPTRCERIRYTPRLA